MRKTHLVKSLLSVFILVSALEVAAFSAEKAPPAAILVDKKTNTLYLSQYADGFFKTVKMYHATLGQVKGDKEDEGDLKTPEGIYTLRARLTPPKLPKKFGVMAFDINYPNTYDQLAGRKGSSIMLHATDEPDRLNKNYDSLGCVVVKNEEIKEILPYVRLGLTPILIFSELTDEFLKPAVGGGELKHFFESWISAWESKEIDSYVDHYHSDFSAQGMNKKAWRGYKKNLNSVYKTIKVGPESVHYYRHPKYSMITFTQNYHSTLKHGGVGHRSRGTKILYVAEEAGKPKIIAETYTTLMW